MARRALITGIEGFTGRYAAEALAARGFEVHGTSLAPATGPGWHQVDLADAAWLSAVVAEIAPSHVLHLAGIAYVAASDIGDMYATNIMGTRNLLVALAAAPPDAVVLASSASVYGNAGGDGLDETTPPCPTNDYAVSKLAMEFLAATFADRLPVTITRPFNYTGIGQSPRFLIAKIVAAFRDRAPVLTLGNIEVAREFSDVRDVADDYAALLESSPRTTVNLAAGVAHSIAEVLALATAITGHHIAIESDPALMRGGEIIRLVGCPAKLRQLVPASRRRPLEETLRWMLG